MADFTLKSRRILTGRGLIDGTVVVEGGRIAAVLDAEQAPEGGLDVGEKVVFPGVVDTHVHVNEPGRTEWEGFETATKAAAAGGVTTIVDMPLNSIPPTTTLEALELKRREAAGKTWVDVGFWGGVVPGNAEQLEPLAEAGALGFKCFLVPSGVDEFPRVGPDDLRQAMPILGKLGLPLLVHAELEDEATQSHPGSGPRSYSTYLATRPKAWENEAVRLMIDLARAHRCRVHVVHLSSADAVGPLERARQEGVPITAETCPHYLVFDSDAIPEGATEYKCAPPIRDGENRDRLWASLLDGTIDFIVSDHSPCAPELKTKGGGAFLEAWGGVASLQFGLAAVWTEARRRGIPLEKLGDWLCRKPARFAGVGDRKGRIGSGWDADLVVWDPEAEFEVAPERILHKHKLTPYAGRKLFGAVDSVFVRGEPVFEKGRPSEKPPGAFLTPSADPIHRAR